MNNELHNTAKKKFSVGAIFCLLAALCIAGFGAWSLVAEGLTLVTNLYTCFSTIHEWPLLIHQVVLLTNSVSNLVAMGATLLTLGTAIALAFLAVAMLLKVNSRFIGLACALPVLATLLSIAMPFIGCIAKFFLMIPYDVSMAGSIATTTALGGLVSAIPSAFVLLSWLAFGAVIFVFGSGKKYSSSKTTLSFILGGAVALLFVISALANVATGVLTNGISLISYISNMIANGIVLDFLYIIENFGSSVYLIINSSVVGAALALAGFFTVLWFVAPFKKDTTEQQEESA